MEKGGNDRLRAFFLEYGLLELPTAKRYRTMGSSFYRDKLRHEVDGQDFFEEISKEMAGILIEGKGGSEPVPDQGSSKPETQEASQGYMSRFWGLWGKTTEIVASTSKSAIEKSYEYSGKLIEKSKDLQDRSLEIGTQLIEKSKEKLSQGKEIGAQLLEKSKEKLIETKGLGEVLLEKGKEKFAEGKEIGAQWIEKGKEKFSEGKELGGKLIEKGKGTVIGVIEKGKGLVKGDQEHEKEEGGHQEEEVKKEENK